MQSSSSLQGAAADGRDRADEISFGKRRDRNLRPHGLRPAILDGEAEEERRAEQQQEANDALANCLPLRIHAAVAGRIEASRSRLRCIEPVPALWRVKASGIGLGLLTCRDIIESHQGQLRIAKRRPEVWFPHEPSLTLCVGCSRCCLSESFTLLMMTRRYGTRYRRCCKPKDIRSGPSPMRAIFLLSRQRYASGC